jgi:hypothetical protein
MTGSWHCRHCVSRWPKLAGNGAVPFVSSNDITAYTVFDSGTGIVSSYAFDTRYPARDPIKFDEFSLI